jgi:hypothetical protein
MYFTSRITLSTSDYVRYLQEAITRWYYNAAIDYGVTGKFLDAVERGNDLDIIYLEEGEELTYTVCWFREYTPDQVYSIWMEQP